MSKQVLRSFVKEYDEAHPGGVIRISELVNLNLEIMAIIRELERRRRSPIVLFENVEGHDIPIICNVYASRRAFSFALGVDETQMPLEYSRRISVYIKPTEVDDAPFRHKVMKGEKADLSKLPIPTYFPGDAAPYITAGMLVGRDPDTGVQTAGYHRLQYKGSNKLGVSLHSRRRMFEYQRRAEEQGKNLECAIVLGLHPILGMSALSYPSPEISKWEVAGGLFGEPLEIAPCETLDLLVPAWAEIVIEGEILANVREPEGPFGEFTGYFSRRSTEHVFMAKTICMREQPWYQSIGSGRALDHLLPLALLREAEILKALSRAIPNVKAVHMPTSGAAAFTAYVSIKQTRPGEAKHAIPIVFGVDHYLKNVIIVDDDIDVFDESDVMWAVATRVQPHRDLFSITDSLGAILDPSATDKGLTSKLGIDATKPYGEDFAKKLLMTPEKKAWAREFVDQMGM